MDFRRPWPFALFVLLAHVLSRFLGVAVHEFLGHSALAFLLGGSAYAVYVSPGSGITYVYLTEGTPVAGVVAMLAAGIAVETAVGVAIWWLTRRSPSAAWRAFGVVAATVFIVYSLVYMAAGALKPNAARVDRRSVGTVSVQPSTRPTAIVGAACHAGSAKAANFPNSRRRPSRSSRGSPPSTRSRSPPSCTSVGSRRS